MEELVIIQARSLLDRVSYTGIGLSSSNADIVLDSNKQTISSFFTTPIIRFDPLFYKIMAHLNAIACGFLLMMVFLFLEQCTLASDLLDDEYEFDIHPPRTAPLFDDESLSEVNDDPYENEFDQEHMDDGDTDDYEQEQPGQKQQPTDNQLYHDDDESPDYDKSNRPDPIESLENAPSDNDYFLEHYDDPIGELESKRISKKVSAKGPSISPTSAPNYVATTTASNQPSPQNTLLTWVPCFTVPEVYLLWSNFHIVFQKLATRMETSVGE